MSKKLKLGFTLTSTMLLTAACNMGMSVEDVSESTDEINNSFENLINSHQELHDLELEMNGHFETVLAEDEELTTIQDNTAAVMQNIDERETIIGSLDENLGSINEQAEALQSYENTDLPADTIQQASDDFLAFTEELENHQARYIESLNVQRDYLQHIASDEANYEDFTNGIDTVNEDYQSLQGQKNELDTRFIAVNDQITSLQDLVAEETAEEATAKNVEANENNEENTEDVADDENETATEDESEDTAANENETENESEDTEDATDEENETEESIEPETQFLALNYERLLAIPDDFPQKFVYDSGVDIPYPEDGVKGIYVTAHSAGGDRMEYLTNLINTTDLNSMVIDIKDDHGNITLDLNSENELVNEMTMDMIDAEELMTLLEENDIYPIARIVVFKDTLLANAQPELSFT